LIAYYLAVYAGRSASGGQSLTRFRNEYFRPCFWRRWAINFCCSPSKPAGFSGLGLGIAIQLGHRIGGSVHGPEDCSGGQRQLLLLQFPVLDLHCIGRDHGFRPFFGLCERRQEDLVKLRDNGHSTDSRNLYSGFRLSEPLAR
jgi:hypothetical protein